MRKSATVSENAVEILLWRNHLQLATADALYSDGMQYIPALLAVKHLGKYISAVKSVLALGAGLGSIVEVLQDNNSFPDITLVDNNEQILGWALEFLRKKHDQLITGILIDADQFMQTNSEKFDFVFVDVFIGRVVPDFVTTTPFFTACKNAMTSHGHIAFNYIVKDSDDFEKAKTAFSSVFPSFQIIEEGINKIFINS